MPEYDFDDFIIGPQSDDFMDQPSQADLDDLLKIMFDV